MLSRRNVRSKHVVVPVAKTGRETEKWEEGSGLTLAKIVLVWRAYQEQVFMGAEHPMIQYFSSA